MKRDFSFRSIAVLGLLVVASVLPGCGGDQVISSDSTSLQSQPLTKPSGLAVAIAAQERHTNALLAIDGVNGTAVGHGPEGRPNVIVLTVRAGVSGIPAVLDGIPVRTTVIGEVVALAKGGQKGPPPKDDPPDDDPPLNPTDRFPRSVPIVVSTGHPAITAGTIGCRVTDGLGNYWALSNNHSVCG